MTRILRPSAPLDPRQRIGHAVPLSVEEALASELRAMSMATLNDALMDWLPNRDLRGVSHAPGGWEEWVQVDLLGQLHVSLGGRTQARWDVRRNVRVYADHDARADMVFNSETANPYHPILVIEVLAESPLVPRPDFLNRMHFEAERLRRANIQPGYARARRMMLAVTVDPATPTVLQKYDFGAVASTRHGWAAMWREVGG